MLTNFITVSNSGLDQDDFINNTHQLYCNLNKTPKLDVNSAMSCGKINIFLLILFLISVFLLIYYFYLIPPFSIPLEIFSESEDENFLCDDNYSAQFKDITVNADYPIYTTSTYDFTNTEQLNNFRVNALNSIIKKNGDYFQAILDKNSIKNKLLIGIGTLNQTSHDVAFNFHHDFFNIENNFMVPNTRFVLTNDSNVYFKAYSATIPHLNMRTTSGFDLFRREMSLGVGNAFLIPFDQSVGLICGIDGSVLLSNGLNAPASFNRMALQVFCGLGVAI